MPTIQAVKASAAETHPANSRRCAQGVETKFAADRPRKLRVLLVEDNAADGELMLDALRKGGFDSKFEVVQTAADFADRIRRNKYEIILADYRLPGWNGMETVAALFNRRVWTFQSFLFQAPWGS